MALNNLYLNGFVTGFRREINGRIEHRIKKEEIKKKRHDDIFSELHLRRIISDIIENEVNKS